MLTGTPEVIFWDGYVNSFRESIDMTDLVHNSPPQLAYLYLRLLVARETPHLNSTHLLNTTKDLLSRLASGPVTPLHHIFASLVATALTELSDRLETQVEAHASIKDMSDALVKDQIVHRSSDGLGWDVALQDLLHQKRPPTPPTKEHSTPIPQPQPNMAGLQHLAAAAVGEREGTDGPRPTSSSQSKIEHDLSAAMAAANEAAKAQATAAAALGGSPNGGGGNSFDAGAMTKDWA